MTTYANLVERYQFVPLAFETFGTWGEDATITLSDIGKKIQHNTGDPRALEFLRQKISVELQRGNAASVLGTLPEQETLSSVFRCYWRTVSDNRFMNPLIVLL